MANANVQRGRRPGDAFGSAPGAGLRAARLALWAVVALLAARQTARALTAPSGERLTGLEAWVGPHGVLHRVGR
ncbi:hypothetical protein [Streptomyces sp. NPDC127190]|uniref:hypothetical protein n=1 Tax=unclassified Streptomyces TaxID=2593676 RepID=UPI0036343220